MIKLLKGNCLDLLRQLEPGCADLVLIDPPYSSGGLFAGDRKQDTRVKYTNADFNGAARLPSFSGDNMDQHSFIQFMTHVSMELRELTKEGGTIAAFIDWRNLPAMTDAIQMAGWVWRGVIVWDKGISRNIPGRFRNDCEYIVWGTNGRKEVDWKAAKGAKAMPGIYHINGVNTKQKHHQTEKPVELLKALIQICPRGGTVVDCFMGSGSTGVACVQEGRNFIGIELGDQYFDTATKRIQEAEDELLNDF